MAGALAPSSCAASPSAPRLGRCLRRRLGVPSVGGRPGRGRLRRSCGGRRALGPGRPLRGAGAAGQDRREELAGVAVLDRGHLLGRALGDDPASAVATLGTHVDDPVGVLDDVEVVLDDDHRVALVDQPVL